MDDHNQGERIRHAVDARLSGLEGEPWMMQRVLANAKGETKVKKKLSVGFVLIIVLVLAAVTALAVGLSNYFSSFAELENTYGQYEQWPKSAKVQLVQTMLDNGVLPDTSLADWDALTEDQKETEVEIILAQYFSGMTYIDTYNVMTRELGPIENWTDEERVLYTSLLEKYGELTDSWPTYAIPGQTDIDREQAISQAREAVLSKFSISEETLDQMTTDAIFAADAYNTVGAPTDEPFWTIEFGYGLAYRIYMSRAGEMLGIMGPQTQFIVWGRNVMDGCTDATSGEQDASREQAIAEARNALTEIMNVDAADVDAMDATAYFFYSDLYAHGSEPVWLVMWSQKGNIAWQVLLGYDASYIDAEPAGKVFDQVLRSETSLSDLCLARYEEVGIPNPYTKDEYYYRWSLEEKASFYNAFADFVNGYVANHPYFTGEGCSEWEWTRNVSALPDERSISQDAAQKIAVTAIQEKLGMDANMDDLNVFYYVTNPDRPEWRFANAYCGIAINAYTGDVITMESTQTDENYTLSMFLAEIL